MFPPQDYNNCICVNPGRVFGGTEKSGRIARLVLHPRESESQKLKDIVAGQILKL